MDSFDQSPASPEAKAGSFIAPEILLSLATGPVLAAIVGSKVLLDAAREIGVLSEELFRGDRLPVLNFPSTPNSHPDNPKST